MFEVPKTKLTMTKTFTKPYPELRCHFHHQHLSWSLKRDIASFLPSLKNYKIKISADKWDSPV